MVDALDADAVAAAAARRNLAPWLLATGAGRRDRSGDEDEGEGEDEGADVARLPPPVLAAGAAAGARVVLSNAWGALDEATAGGGAPRAEYDHILSNPPLHNGAPAFARPACPAPHRPVRLPACPSFVSFRGGRCRRGSGDYLQPHANGFLVWPLSVLGTPANQLPFLTKHLQMNVGELTFRQGVGPLSARSPHPGRFRPPPARRCA